MNGKERGADQAGAVDSPTKQDKKKLYNKLEQEK